MSRQATAEKYDIPFEEWDAMSKQERHKVWRRRRQGPQVFNYRHMLRSSFKEITACCETDSEFEVTAKLPNGEVVHFTVTVIQPV